MIQRAVLQSVFIKTLILGACFIYLLRPVQSHAYALLHEAVHYLEAIGSDENKTRAIHSHDTAHHHHEFLGFDTVLENTTQKTVHSEEHSHKLLAFFSSISSENSSHNDSEEHILEMQVDKHILPEPHIYSRQKTISGRLNKWSYRKELVDLYFDISLPPPQISIQ